MTKKLAAIVLAVAAALLVQPTTGAVTAGADTPCGTCWDDNVVTG